MGFFDGWDGSSVISSSKSHKNSKSSKHRSSKRDRSRSRSRSRARSRHGHQSSSGLSNFLTGGSSGNLGRHDSHYSKHNASRSSFFNLGNNSSRSLFGLGRSSSSFYKRSPRSSFVQRMYRKLKRLLRDLVYYAKRHPWKVFMIVIMPLITGGALTALLARFGLRLPPTIERWLGVAARTASGDSMGLVGEAVRMVGGQGNNSGVRVEKGHGGNMQWERRSEWDYGNRGGGSGGGGFMDSVYKFFD